MGILSVHRLSPVYLPAGLAFFLDFWYNLSEVKTIILPLII